jgi:DNA-binding response OmpR family regulator
MARVLVVDDDKLVGGTIQAILERHGYNVVVTHGGRDVLSTMDAGAFGVVLVDLIMPGVDGIDTIKTVHDRAPGVPVIAMSGYSFHGGSSDRDFFRLATDASAERCLHKPFKPAELLEVIETCRATHPDPAASLH